jgi:hypothetical protein
MKSDGPVKVARSARAPVNIRVGLITGLSVLLLVMIGCAFAGLLWLAALTAVAVAFIGALLFDVARPKNAAWQKLRGQFGESHGTPLERKTVAAGRGQLGDYHYFGVRCFGSPEELEIGRIMSFLNPPLYIPWSAITKIDAFPNLLTGRRDFETDMQAQIILRDQPDLEIEIPWLKEYRQLLPKSVRFRSIKLSKK